MSDIRKWFMKQHEKNGSSTASKKVEEIAEKSVVETTEKRKSSKFVVKEPEREKITPTKRKTVPVKKVKDEEDDDFEGSSEKKKKATVNPSKRLKKEPVAVEGDDEEDDLDEDREVTAPGKTAGRGKGGRGAGGTPARGRGRGGGGGRGGFMFGERKDPPHKGEKEIPEGAPDCLAGLTFVISGTLDSLEREEAEDLIKRHGGRVTGSVSSKTSFLLCDEDIGGNKSAKAKALGTRFLTEDGLFDMIRKSKPTKSLVKEDTKTKPDVKSNQSQIKRSPMKNNATEIRAKGDQLGSKSTTRTTKSSLPIEPARKQIPQSGQGGSLTWTEKYKPKNVKEIIGNPTIVKELHDWLENWHRQFLQYSDQKGKGKKQNDSSKKAVLLSGTPGIGKSTSAKLISQELGFQTIEVNASDSRGKADSKIVRGIGGSTSNSIKELISNQSLNINMDWSKHPKTVLIMDEVDGMSAGDRGGVADLIASIKISKVPIICICNDRYSQKLKSLINYCIPLNFRKPTKQQMAKRLMQIATQEGLKVNDIALEELADRVNGDVRMAINQLQYMKLSQNVITYDDIRERLHSSTKDEDISPFTAADKLLGVNGGKLRMDERMDLSMSDPDLIPLIIQENYINYRPLSCGKDENGVKRLNLLARAAESIADGDIVGVQIRRYRQWQLSQAATFASTIIPAALMHGPRQTLEQGERNYNRFGGWLGKNSTMGKNLRLLEDVHVHILASQGTYLNRSILRMEYFSILLKQLTEPLKVMPKDTAVQTVVEFMNTYSLSQEHFDTIVELSKYKSHPNPLEGIQPAVKSALTRAYKEASKHRTVRVADMINLPGIKKAPKKKIAAILDPIDEVDINLPEQNGDELGESDEEHSSDTGDAGDDIKLDGEGRPKLELENSKLKGIQVQLNLKTDDKPKTQKTPASKSRASASAEKGGQSSGKGGKRKR